MDLFTKSLILKEKEEKTGKLLLPGLLTGIIPEDLTTLEHLDTIIIQDSKCSKITFPSNLQKLTKLKNIHIHQTLITEIPEELFSAISITNLCLGGNKIEHISENICNLKI
ncbi:hypothetical protein [Hymenobacter sp. 102]|uniref:hypothetical protein n=1 Tax=Hymenobacter sp. 102 TaxID=3403152 RepID=UPI003CE721F1